CTRWARDYGMDYW
nr:immunoglobulin heavy chain junction region [Mus musculus]